MAGTRTGGKKQFAPLSSDTERILRIAGLKGGNPILLKGKQ